MCLCGSQNKQRLFPFTALTDWFYNRDLTLYNPVVTICTTSLTFNNSTFCPHSEFMCLVWISEQTAIFPYTTLTVWFYNRDLTVYSPVVTICTTSLTFNNSTFCPHSEFMCLCGSQNKHRLFPYTALTDWFYNRDLTVYSPVVTICTTSLTFNNCTFCPHSKVLCFLWISEQTAIISLYNFNWLVCITEI